jgi:hypothetical protein
MSRYPFILVSFLIAAAYLPASAAEKRVYRVDSVIATMQGGTITIQAKGAVQSGGWKKPRLRLTHTEAHTLAVEFVAQPPEAGAAVIEALLPITANLQVKAPHDTLAVRATADANEMTTQVLTTRR